MRVVVKLGGSLLKEAPEIIERLIEEFARQKPGHRESIQKDDNSSRLVTGKEKLSGIKASGRDRTGKGGTEEGGTEEGRTEEGRTEEGGAEEGLDKTGPEFIIIVPGGGIFANAVREADRTFGLGADASHWMAVLGMEQYACCLLDKSRAVAAYSIEKPEPGVSVLFPYGLLKAMDPLPHSWDVTSDTIAAWVARQTDARFVKATDVDGIFMDGKLVEEISAPDLAAAGSSCTDRALPEFLRENRMDCMIVNGKYPERVLLAVYGGTAPGTAVKGNI